MNHSQVPIDEVQWKGIGRRWFTVLAVLMTINLSLIVLGVNTCLDRASVASASTPSNDGQIRAAATETPPTTSDQQTLVAQQRSSPPLPEDSSASATDAVATAAVLQSIVARGDDDPADGTPSVTPIATASTPPGEVDASQQAGADSPRLPAKHQVADDKSEQSAPDDALPKLTIINPPATRGIVHYTLDGKVQSLSPGEYQCLDAGQERQLEFHQGDDLGYTERVVSTGFFVFNVSELGWELVPSAEGASRRLLRSCRSVDPNK